MIQGPDDPAGPAVHKFGGSSLADAVRFRGVVEVLAKRPASHRVIVVSAVGGVTDRLVRIVTRAGNREPSYRDELESLRQDQLVLVAALVDADALTPDRAGALRTVLESDLEEAADVLRGAYVLRHSSPGPPSSPNAITASSRRSNSTRIARCSPWLATA